MASQKNNNFTVTYVEQDPSVVVGDQQNVYPCCNAARTLVTTNIPTVTTNIPTEEDMSFSKSPFTYDDPMDRFLLLDQNNRRYFIVDAKHFNNGEILFVVNTAYPATDEDRYPPGGPRACGPEQGLGQDRCEIMANKYFIVDGKLKKPLNVQAFALAVPFGCEEKFNPRKKIYVFSPQDERKCLYACPIYNFYVSNWKNTSGWMESFGFCHFYLVIRAYYTKKIGKFQNRITSKCGCHSRISRVLSKNDMEKLFRGLTVKTSQPPCIKCGRYPFRCFTVKNLKFECKRKKKTWKN